MTNSEKFVSQINPSALAHYLRGKGWVQFKIRRIDIEIYQYLMDGQLLEQVTIPIDKELFDYSEALYESMQAVAGFEGRSVEEILKDLRADPGNS